MLDKNFDHQKFESTLYTRWETHNQFQPRYLHNAATPASANTNKAYTIVLPPPNVTGSLHVGHAQDHTLQDILIRHKRMSGFATLWQPGTDHAGIATQMMVERHLTKQNIDRRNIGREAFIEHVWAWKNEYGGRIVNQQKRLGESCDWSRQRFTMDDGLSRAVTKVFVTLHQQGLIYRDQRLVNWDTQLQTALSDLEVESKEIKGKLYHIRYPLVKGEGESDTGVIVATTRPETLFGDMAVAVHPADDRYQHMIGKHLVLPLTGRHIPIVADEHADPEQGSGAVKITPAHDFNDFEVGKRHHLTRLSVMDKRGYLNSEVPQDFVGLERFAARQKVLAALEAQGLLIKTEDHVHTVPHGDRSKSVLEPMLTEQWYLNAKVLAQPAIKAVEDGRTRIIPEMERNRFFSWMRDIQPWCISRQLWWGHRIPAWYAEDGTIFVAETAREANGQAEKHFGKTVALKRDEDVLDTWFSSALWPFSALGWPDQNDPALQLHYPNDVLITGTDILFFWVARMMMMGMHFMNDVPFRTVFLHGLVRDGQGHKMSKTLGNVIDPLELSKTKGTDALRFALCALTVQGRDTRLSDQRLEVYRNFITKLWNASRFLDHHGIRLQRDAACPNVGCPHNHWLLQQLKSTIIEADQALAEYRFNDYAATLYRLVWNKYCDWYIELIKPVLQDVDHPERLETLDCAAFTLVNILKLLHPVTPFVTEELLNQLSDDKQAMLINAAWPNIHDLHGNATAADGLQWLCDLITTIRSMKVSMGIAPAQFVALDSTGFSANQQNLLQHYQATLKTLAHVTLDCQPYPTVLRVPYTGGLIHLHLADDIDLTAVAARLHKEQQKCDNQLRQTEKRLNNADFVAKAPPEVLEENHTRLSSLQQQSVLYRKILDALA